MRILLVAETFAPATDPVAEAARHLTDALISAGHDLLVVAAGPGQGSYRGARVLRTRSVLPVGVRTSVEEFAPDAAWFLAPRAMGAAAMRTLEPLGIPTLVVDPTPLHPRTGTVLTTSRSGARVLAAAGIRAGLWEPGVRTDEHHPGLRSAELRDRWARTEGVTVVGYVGPVGLPTSKRVRRLSRIAALEGVRLVVLGCGPGTAVLKEAGAKIVGDSNGLELARGIASLDVLVQPRKQDGALGPIRKALASGVPVVGFDRGAITEVVRDRRNGLLVSSGAGLATAVGRLASDEQLRGRLAANARDSVSHRGWDIAVAELLAYSAPLPAVV